MPSIPDCDHEVKEKTNAPSAALAPDVTYGDPKEKITAEEQGNTREDHSSITEFDAGPVPAPLYRKPPTRQFVLIMIALALCVFLASLDQIIVSTSIPAITSEYSALGDISWLGTAYMMTSTAFQPL
ncbi:hypothetical protein EC968_005692 [Mortierella alpina]|nr:hypothetical protein EC968_005692 [Mortierella alpina]